MPPEGKPPHAKPHHPHAKPPHEKPPHAKPHPPHVKRSQSGRFAPSQIERFVDADAIEALLEPFVTAPEERAFVRRCIVGEGPAHHRGANFVLLRLMETVTQGIEEAAAARGARPVERDGASVPVPLRLPAHLEESVEDRDFPLRLPVDPIARLSPQGTPAFDAMIDCLTDGPPQHALANVAMVALLDRALRAVDALGAAPARDADPATRPHDGAPPRP